MSVPVGIAVEFLLNSIAQLAKASALIGAAQAQGRGLTEMEWQDVVEGNNNARSDAQAAVDNAIIEGR